MWLLRRVGRRRFTGRAGFANKTGRTGVGTGCANEDGITGRTVRWGRFRRRSGGIHIIAQDGALKLVQEKVAVGQLFLEGSDIGTGLLEGSDLVVEAGVAFGQFNNEAFALVIFGEGGGLTGLEFGGIHLVFFMVGGRLFVSTSSCN